jgi:hypothetical protein
VSFHMDHSGTIDAVREAIAGSTFEGLNDDDNARGAFQDLVDLMPSSGVRIVADGHVGEGDAWISVKIQAVDMEPAGGVEPGSGESDQTDG